MARSRKSIVFTLFVNRAVEIGPAPLDFDIGFVDAPGPSSRASEAVPTFLELRNIALDPTHDRRVRQGEPEFGDHLDEVAKAELVAEIPAHTEDDDFTIEMATLKSSPIFSALVSSIIRPICR